MDFADSPAEAAFRAELRAWLRTHLPDHRRQYPPSDDELTLHPDKSFDACRAWHRRMHAGGWVGLRWPREYGGRGASLVEQLIFAEELIAAGAPPGVNTIGLGMVAPPDFLSHLTVFALACIVGWQVVWNVTPALHTPLMSVTNAISGIIVIGGMLQVSGPPSSPIVMLGAAAILLAAINIAGGFLVTQRMLRMFRR